VTYTIEAIGRIDTLIDKSVEPAIQLVKISSTEQLNCSFVQALSMWQFRGGSFELLAEALDTSDVSVGKGVFHVSLQGQA
jgi:hypothetical protein